VINSKEKKIDAKKVREEVKKTYAEAISRKNLISKGIKRVVRGADIKVASIKISAYKPAL